MKKRLPTIMLCVYVLLHAASADGQEEAPVLVGRISFMQGSLLRHVPETGDWTELVQDAPFGLQDTVRTGGASRAEIMLPNSTLIRMDENSQVQLLRLDTEVTEVDIAAGTVRICNLSSSAIIRAATPFGQAVAPAQTAVDLSVGDSSAEARCVRGSAYFIHAAGTSKYDLVAGSHSLIAGRGMVSPGDGTENPRWLDWNAARDRLWESRRAASGASQKYLPPQLRDEAYALEENGRWEYVPYGTSYYYLWRPVHVHAGWAPFTGGRWTLWYGDHCWIPDEPFGYVTHHYGTWVYVDSRRCWYWAPPLVAVVVGHPFGLPCAWYPGRVAWIYSDLYIGWIPLMPYETYYCSRYWGPGSFVVTTIVIGDGHGHRHGHKHHHDRHAVLVGKSHMYETRNYRSAGLCRRGDATGHEFRATALLDDSVAGVGAHGRDRSAFKPGGYIHKPGGRVLDRVRKNLAAVQRERKLDAAQFMDKVKRMKPGELRSRTEPFAQHPFGRLAPVRTPDRPRREDSGSPGMLKPATPPQPVRIRDFPKQTPVFAPPQGVTEPRHLLPPDTMRTGPRESSGRDTAPFRFFSNDGLTAGGSVRNRAGSGGLRSFSREQPSQAGPPRIMLNPRSRGF